MPQTKFYAVGPHEGKTVSLDRFDFVDGVYTFTGSPQETELVAKTLRTQYQAYPEAEFEEAKKAYDDAQAEAVLAEPETTPAISEMNLKQRIVARRFLDEGLDPDSVYGPGEAANLVKANMDALRAEEAEGSDLVATAEEIAAQRVRAEQERREAELAEQARLAAEQQGQSGEPAPENTSPSGEQAHEQPQDNGGGEQAPVEAKIETVADALQALDPANDEHWTSRGVPSIEAMTKMLGRAVTRAEIEAVAPDYTRSVAKAAKAPAAN